MSVYTIYMIRVWPLRCVGSWLRVEFCGRKSTCGTNRLVFDCKHGNTTQHQNGGAVPEW